MAFSDGEVSQGPDCATVNGRVVVDGSICRLGKGAKPLVLDVEKSKVVRIVDGDPAQVKQLERIFATVAGSDNFAEIGLGLNPESLINGDFEEEKKARGTCHLAIGDDIFFGGTTRCSIHWDMVMYNVTAEMDGVCAVSGGTVNTHVFAG